MKTLKILAVITLFMQINVSYASPDYDDLSIIGLSDICTEAEIKSNRKKMNKAEAEWSERAVKGDKVAQFNLAQAYEESYESLSCPNTFTLLDGLHYEDIWISWYEKSARQGYKRP